MGTGTGDEVDTQEEEEAKGKIDDFESQVSLSSSTHEHEASTNLENGYSDRYSSVRTINKTFDGIQHSREFMTMTNSDVQSGTTRTTGSETTPVELEADYQKTSRQRGLTQVSNSTKLPGTNKVTPPLVTPLVAKEALMEEVLTRIGDSMGERSEQMSIRMSELERAVHVEREKLRQEIICNRQEVSRSEKCLKTTEKYLARNLS